MKTLYACIYWTVTESHPDFKYVKDTKKELCFRDIYTDPNNYYDDYKQFENYVKSDLALVAGGGYNTDHIKNVRFDIFKASDFSAIKENKVQKFMKEFKGV